MNHGDIQWKSITKRPGVYFFMGTQREILYIGKATSLKSRIKSYFSRDIREKRSLLIEKMVHEARKVEWTETDSVLEAMLLETNLIRTHKPRYNTVSKDDKSYNHLVITRDEFPRVLVVRGKDLLNGSEEYSHVYGPFPSSSLFKEALKIIRKLFQFYDGGISTKIQLTKMEKGKLDFNRQIGLYPHECTKSEYARTIRHIRLFFEGKKSIIIRELEKRMATYAKREEFERAHEMKKKIFALRHIQDIALIKDDVREYHDDKCMRIEAYDVAHMAGKDMVGVMTVVERGSAQPSEYRKFTIRTCSDAHDTKALHEMFERRMSHTEWVYPALIVVDGGIAQVRVVERILTARNIVVPVVGVVKDEHHKPQRIVGSEKLIAKHVNEILLANGEAHRCAISFHRKRRKVV